MTLHDKISEGQAADLLQSICDRYQLNLRTHSAQPPPLQQFNMVGEIVQSGNQNAVINPLQQYAADKLESGGALTFTPAKDGGFTISLAKTCYICGDGCKEKYWKCKICVLLMCRNCWRSNRGCDYKQNHIQEEF
ncbi:hypothetical protein BT63DRAFT_163940 [Microthyrium microscopicum]|uniref:Uncharacterized protein n=1 Tax=Microthyrium microscopicum TaxID=703497 RepID=A0A6A6UQG7_9PEZI|nr:hypothetical protein BT63DRAFT_163940 [Microthyrium microscopicum]